MHHLGPQFLQGNGIGQRLAATLKGKGFVDITDRESLPVNGADADAPEIGTIACQLGNVIGHFARGIRLAFEVDFLNVLGEAREVRYDELLTECFGNQHNVRTDHAE